jgi:hypothetical protein
MNNWTISSNLQPFQVTNPSLNINLKNTSEPRIKRKGERGSPCLKPLFGVNKPKGLLLIKIEKEEEDMHNLIQFIQIGWKPSLSMMARRNSHSILSKAFFMSILINIKLPLPFFVFERVKKLMC